MTAVTKPVGLPSRTKRRQIKALPRGHADRRALAQTMRKRRAEYQKAHRLATGVKRQRILPQVRRTNTEPTLAGRKRLQTQRNQLAKHYRAERASRKLFGGRKVWGNERIVRLAGAHGEDMSKTCRGNKTSTLKRKLRDKLATGQIRNAPLKRLKRKK